MSTENLIIRRRIALVLLNAALDADGFAACPGSHLHHGKSGPRDFRIILEGAPTAFCFHSSCAAVVDKFNLELRRRIAVAERGDEPLLRAPSMMGDEVPPPPLPPRRLKRPPFEPLKLAQFAGQCRREITLDWLSARSPVPVAAAVEQGPETARQFLDALYDPDERVLVFNRFYSQGDFMWTAGGGGCVRLADKQGVAPVTSPLPHGGPEGVWFLNQPITGEWKINHAATSHGSPRWGRRHGDCVTAWRYLVLESDVADPDLWLRALVLLPLPIAAIYTSGGQSIHALIRLDAEDKPTFDAIRDELVQVVCPLGADAAAMTAVRLTRLPGMLRHGKTNKEGILQRYDLPRLQRLAWLNPEPALEALVEIAK
jgi:hypothetical protein